MPLDAHTPVAVRPHGTLVVVALAVVIVAAGGGLLTLEPVGASTKWVLGGLWILGLAAAAAIAFAASLGVMNSAKPVFAGLATATQIIGAAFFLTLAGVVFASGYDGLVFPLGLGAGCLLLQLVVAPRLASSGAASLPAFFAARYSSRTVDALVAIIVIASMVTLLAAEVMAAGLVGANLSGLTFAQASIVAACAMLACFVLRGAGGASWATGLLYAVLLAVLLVPLVQLSAEHYGLPIPQLAYANALWQAQGLEETLLEQELADPAFLKPMMTAFLNLTPINFIGIALGLAAGVAALPSLASMQPAGRNPQSARWSALWTLVFVALLVTLAPAIAAYVRLSVATLISERTAISELPAWVFTFGKLGLLHVCGEVAPDADVVAAACASLPEAPTALRLQDVVLSPEMVTLAFPQITGLNGVLTGCIAAAALAVALVTAHGPLAAIVRAVGIDDGGDSTPAAQRSARLISYGVAAAVLAAAVLAAMARPAGIIEVAAGALVLTAVGLFPALVAGLWWRRANAWGAAASILLGPAAVLLYLAASRYFPVPFFEATSILSSAGETGIEYFAELKDAWIAAEPGAAKDAAWLDLEAQARIGADWWGIGALASALLALPVGFLALLVGSLVTPRAAARAA